MNINVVDFREYEIIIRKKIGEVILDEEQERVLLKLFLTAFNHGFNLGKNGNVDVEL
jgi:hypothetical protein